MQSFYALEYLRNKVVLQADLSLMKHLGIDISYRWMDRVGTYEEFLEGKGTGKAVSYKPYSLLDAKVSWQQARWSIYLQGENILDARYFDHGNIPQPGFWLKVGTIVSL